LNGCPANEKCLSKSVVKTRRLEKSAANCQRGGSLTLTIDYENWKREYAPVLETFTGKTIFVLYSGGKDSSAMLHLFDQARRDLGFAFQVHAGAFPHHRYTQAEKHRLANYWQARNVNITWHAVAATDDELNEGSEPCHKCQQIRKKLLQRYLLKTAPPWNEVVLVISYSLWDLVSYTLENLLGGLLAQPNEVTGVDQRFLETAQRFYPLLEMKEGYQIFRPLIRFNDTEIEALINVHKIPVLAIPCAHKSHRPKRVLGQYYASQELRFDYDRVLTFARDVLNLPEKSVFRSLSKEDYLGRVF